MCNRLVIYPTPPPHIDSLEEESRAKGHKVRKVHHLRSTDYDLNKDHHLASLQGRVTVGMNGRTAARSEEDLPCCNNCERRTSTEAQV